MELGQRTEFQPSTVAHCSGLHSRARHEPQIGLAEPSGTHSQQHKALTATQELESKRQQRANKSAGSELVPIPLTDIRLRGVATAVEPAIIHGHRRAPVGVRSGPQPDHRHRVGWQGQHSRARRRRAGPPPPVREPPAHPDVLHMRAEHVVLRHHGERETALSHCVRRHVLRVALHRRAPEAASGNVPPSPSVGPWRGMARGVVSGGVQLLVHAGVVHLLVRRCVR